jgi:hypothetical protein
MCAFARSGTFAGMFARAVLIRILLPVTWRHVRSVQAGRLMRFSVTETDSAWQILDAMRHVTAPAGRVRMLQHALEEVHHASEFARVARGLCPVAPRPPLAERQPLCGDDPAGVPRFLAYAHVGEQDVFDQFDAYAAGIGEGDAQRVFRESKLDELGHVGLTWSMLVEATGDAARARRMVWRARLRRAWESWLRFSTGIGAVTSGVLLAAAWAIATMFLALPARSRLRAS